MPLRAVDGEMNFWIVIQRFARVTMAGLLLLAIGHIFIPQYQEYRELQRREMALRDDIRENEERLLTLKLKQERFQTDPAFVERIAHDIGLARPNETVVRFVDEPLVRPR